MEWHAKLHVDVNNSNTTYLTLNNWEHTHVVILPNEKYSSFNMTRGDEDIEGGGLWKFLDTRKGGSEKILGRRGNSENSYTSKPTGGGGLKFQASSFTVFILPPKNTKHATEFEITLFKWCAKILLNVTKKPFNSLKKVAGLRRYASNQNNY